MIVPVAHDFTCAWCWIGMHQAFELRSHHGIALDWRGYEQYPEDMDFPEPMPMPELPDRPRIPTRLELALAAQGLSKPRADRPKNVRTHNAHEAVELGKQYGVADEVVERIYRAYWLNAENIGIPDVLVGLLADILDEGELRHHFEDRRYAAHITPFDEPAHATGVFNIPTFWIAGQRYAEQPLSVLVRAVEAAP